MAFELPDLPYSHDALASHGMSRETLEYHHDIHHKAYVDNGNKAIAGTEWENKPVEEIIKGTYDPKSVAQSGIFNNASQYWNHNQFWEMMAPGGTKMPGEVEKAITDAFGGFDQFKEGVRRRRRGSVRLRLGVAGQGYRWQRQDHQDRERREPALLRSDGASGL